MARPTDLPKLRAAARRFARIRLDLALALGRDPTDAEVWAEFRSREPRAAAQAVRLARRRDPRWERSEDDPAADEVAAVLEADVADVLAADTARVMAEIREQEEPRPVDLGFRLRRPRRG